MCAATAVLFLSGCSALGQQAVIENRLHQYQNGSDSGTIVLAVSTSEVSSADGGISLTALSDRGQAALIDKNNGKPPATIKADAGEKSVVIDDSVKRHVVIAVRPVGFLAPGDRVDAVRVSLQVAAASGPNWLISSWTQASNGEIVIDLGKLTDTHTTKASLSAGLKLAAAIPSLNVGGESDRAQAREVEIKDTTDFDAAVDNDGRAWLDETAGWRQSLAHNLAMDVVLTPAKGALESKGLVAFTSLAVDDQKNKGKTVPAKPSEVHLSETLSYSPRAFEKEPICGWATLTYRIRHINNGGYATFSESDDAVTFETGFSESPFLFSPPPYEPRFVIKNGAGNVLSYQLGNSAPRRMVFRSAEDAGAFRDWMLIATPWTGRVGDATIGFDDGDPRLPPLPRARIGQLNPQLEDEQFAKTMVVGSQSCRTILKPADSPASPLASSSQAESASQPGTVRR